MPTSTRLQSVRVNTYTCAWYFTYVFSNLPACRAGSLPPKWNFRTFKNKGNCT